MKRPWPASAAMTVLACCGCASAPVRYYSLTPAAGLPSQAPTVVCCTVELRGMHIPAEVDRPELVTRRSGEQLEVLGNDVWLAPLRDEVKSALLARIRLGVSEAAATDTPPATQRFIVFIDVERFESVLGQHALLQVQWRVEAMGPATPAMAIACETTVNIDVNDGVSALVRGHQQALAVIGDRIATDLVRWRPGGAAHCSSST